MAFDITGKLVAKFDVVQRTETFRTREFVIEVNEDVNGRTITNFIKFQAVQDRTALLDRFNIGDTVKVNFNIRGTKWEKNGQTNYITNLDAWRIEQAGMGNTQTPPTTTTTTTTTAPTPPVDKGDADDLPF